MPPYLEVDMLIEMLAYMKDDLKSLKEAINLSVKKTKEAKKILNQITWTQFEKNKSKLIEKRNLCNNMILFIQDYLKEFKDI